MINKLWITLPVVYSRPFVSKAESATQTDCVGTLSSIVPQGKFTELCSSAATVSQSISTEFCSSATAVPQSKSTEKCSSAAPFDHDLR